MKTIGTLAVALMLSTAAPALAQDINAQSGSNSAANSGSQSASSSDANHQAQQQAANNEGIGNSHSASGAESTSTAVTDSRSISDQGQVQNQGQTALNSQGVTVNQTWNSTNHKRSYVGTNTAIPLAAASSFSSDYCGGTVSGGASAAPIGISIGGAAPKMDKSCQYLRVAEKAGMLGANYHNAGYEDMAARAFTLEAWATCNAGPDNDNRHKDDSNRVMNACMALGLLGSDYSAATPPSPPPPPVSAPPEVTPEATQKYYREKTPRGEVDPSNSPVIQPLPVMAAAR